MQHQDREGRHGVLRSWWAAARSPWPTAETALHHLAPVQQHEAAFDIRQRAKWRRNSPLQSSAGAVHTPCAMAADRAAPSATARVRTIQQVPLNSSRNGYVRCGVSSIIKHDERPCLVRLITRLRFANSRLSIPVWCPGKSA